MTTMFTSPGPYMATMLTSPGAYMIIVGRGRSQSAAVGSRIVVRYDEGKRQLVSYPGVVIKCTTDAGERMMLHVRFDGEPAELYEVEEAGEDDWVWEDEVEDESWHKRPRRR